MLRLGVAGRHRGLVRRMCQIHRKTGITREVSGRADSWLSLEANTWLFPGMETPDLCPAWGQEARRSSLVQLLSSTADLILSTRQQPNKGSSSRWHHVGALGYLNGRTSKLTQSWRYSSMMKFLSCVYGGALGLIPYTTIINNI